MANRYKKEIAKKKKEDPNYEEPVGNPLSAEEWNKLINYYEDTTKEERLMASLAPRLRMLEERTKELQKEANQERERRSIIVIGQKFELKELSENIFYGSAESDDLAVIAQITDEVEEQGLFTRCAQGEETKFRVEFIKVVGKL